MTCKDHFCFWAAPIDHNYALVGLCIVLLHTMTFYAPDFDVDGNIDNNDKYDEVLIIQILPSKFYMYIHFIHGQWLDLEAVYLPSLAPPQDRHLKCYH